MNIFKQIWASLTGPAQKPPAKAQPSQTAGGRRGPVVQVRPDSRPYWQTQGWRKRGRTITGYYRTERGSYSGKIVFEYGQPQFYIHNPPAAIFESRHHACFNDRKDGWYWVHFSKSSQTPDAGIVAIEAVLFEALSNRRH